MNANDPVGRQDDRQRPENILVTGGGGFLGKAIVRRLVDRGHGVRSFSRGHYPQLDQWGVAQVAGDLADADAVDRACRGIAAVFHVAAKPGVWGRRESFFRTNVTGTANVLAACRRHGVGRLIYTSSPSVVFDGSDMAGVDESAPYPQRYLAHYPETKARAERLVRAAAAEGLPAVILRPHLIWGPEDNHLVPRLLARGPKLARVGDGRNRVDTVYVDNAAEAHLLACTALARRPEISGRIYFISNGEPVALWELIDAILAAGGQPPVRRSVSLPAARAAGAVLEALYRVLPLSGEPPMTRFVAEEVAKTHWFDISAARRDLGYVPQVSMQEGLERLARWLKEKPGPTDV